MAASAAIKAARKESCHFHDFQFCSFKPPLWVQKAEIEQTGPIVVRASAKFIDQNRSSLEPDKGEGNML
jgi:hypothetical protein